MPRLILTTPGHAVLRHASTRVLNRYANGTVLLDTDAPQPESGDEPEVRAETGLRLAASDDDIAAARKRFLPAARRTSRAPQPDSGRPITAYVEFIGPVDVRWLEQVRAQGITVLTYQPHNAYLCLGTPQGFRAARTQVLTSEGTAAIASVTELAASLKPRLPNSAESWQPVVILLTCSPDEKERLVRQLGGLPDVELVDGAGNDDLSDNLVRLRARVQGDGEAGLLSLPNVIAVEPYAAPVAEDEIAGLIIAGQMDARNRPNGSYVQWLDDHGVDGRGTAIGIVDGGVDTAHPAFSGRARDLTGGQKDWHATMVAGHAAGCYLAERDANNFIYGLGTAPAAQVLSQDKMQAASFLCRQTVREAGDHAAVQNNSWGKGTRNPMDYGSDEALYDSLVRNADPSGPRPLPLTVCFSSGNSGAAGLTRPKAAKNVIVTGNSENFRPEAGSADSDNIDEVYSGAHGSSTGNCGDGRIRPHLVAPGEWTASANFDCRAGEAEYISPLCTYGGGSSGASPKTAGACALLIDWWRRNHTDQLPSPAMLRALLVNGAQPIQTGGAVPNNRQGWGRLNVRNVVDPQVAHVLVDQSITLAHPLESREWRIRAVDPARPVRITLAWTDPPGAIGTGGSRERSPIVNRLTLRATMGGRTYKGVQDRFRQGFSQTDEDLAGTGGVELLDEGSDNLQNIFLAPRDAGGLITVSVTALNLTTNCLSGGFDQPLQDFAMVVSNALAATEDRGVVVAFDARAGDAAPSDTERGYWSGTPGNDDIGMLGQSVGADDGAAAWATSVAPVLPVDAPAGAAEAAETAWWRSQADADLDSEATRPARRPGLPLANAMLHMLGAAAPSAATGSRDAAAPTSQQRDLRAEIARLQAAAQEGCNAVLVVGAGSRFSVADVDALRALGTATRLLIVSDDAPLIAFLAQRIGPARQISYSLAEEPRLLETTVLAAVAGAAQLQELVVSAPLKSERQVGVVWTYSFDTVPADLGLLVQVRDSAPGPKELRLSRPDGTVFWWSQDTADSGGEKEATVRIEDGTVLLRDANLLRLKGTWTLEVRGRGSAAPESVRAWVAGGPTVLIDKNRIDGTAAGSARAVAQLLKLTPEPGTALTRAVIDTSRTAAAFAASGEGRPPRRIAEVRRSRLDAYDAIAAEGGRGDVLAVPALGRVLDMPAPATPSSASVVDLQVDVSGVDGAGNRFVRRMSTNLVERSARSAWRRQAELQVHGLQRVRGRIADVRFDGAKVVSIRISQGAQSCWVTPATPQLASQLAVLKRSRRFTFELAGRTLHAVWLALDEDAGVAQSPPAGADDRGIEAPLQEPAAPVAEANSVDYPGASRFVSAASYRKWTAATSRTVARVVIHITDGGASIEGPIRWFQDPASRVSAHYIVGQDGEVVQMVRERDIAWHANRANADSIGIEHCARAPGARGNSDPGLKPSALEYEASAALVRWLCEQYGLPLDRDHIVGHAEADTTTTHHQCPNAAWDWDHYIRLVRSGMSLPPSSDETVPETTPRPQRSAVPTGTHAPGCHHG